MKRIYITIVLILMILIVGTLHMIDTNKPQTKRVLEIRPLEIKDIEPGNPVEVFSTTTSTYEMELASVMDRDMIPSSTNVYSFILNRTDGSTTTLNLFNFATDSTSTIAGFYRPSDESINIRIVNYESFKPLFGDERLIPEVQITVLIHELFHSATQYAFSKCPDVFSSKCQEFGAYNYDNLYRQIRSLDEDSLLRLSKD